MSDYDVVTEAQLNAIITAVASRINTDGVRWTSGTTRPTSRTDVLVIFIGPDPTTNALSGDIWLGA